LWARRIANFWHGNSSTYEPESGWVFGHGPAYQMVYLPVSGTERKDRIDAARFRLYQNVCFGTGFLSFLAGPFVSASDDLIPLGAFEQDVTQSRL